MSAGTVWLASYPKSGNTWLRAVLTAWKAGGPLDLGNLAGSAIASDRHLFDQLLGLPSSCMTADEVEIARPRVDELIAAGADEPLPRKVHDAWFRGPAGEPILSVGATRAALYMIRDPRDVAVSYAHHAGQSFEWACLRLSDPGAASDGDPGRLHRQLRQRLGTWSEHVRSWVDETPFPVEVVRYEDCVATPVETFARALRFTGVDVGDETAVADAVERAAFAELRRAEEEHGFAERPTSARQAFFRRGESGGWRDELPAELAALVAADHGEVMARFGYEPD